MRNVTVKGKTYEGDKVMGKVVNIEVHNTEGENSDTFGIPTEVWDRMPERAKDVIRRANGQ